MFNEFKAEKLANTAWEIINPGYIDSPEIRYRIKLEGEDYLDIVIMLGYKLKVVIGDELNGDRIAVLEAIRLNNALGFHVESFHEGAWCKTIQATHKNVLKARHEARTRAFAPIQETTPIQRLKLIIGGR